MDYYRRKYKAYDIFGMVYSPVMVSVEWVKEKHIVGHEKVYAPGEPLITKIWVTNDDHREYRNAKLLWRIRDPKGMILAEETSIHTIPEDSSQVVEGRTWEIPQAAEGLFRMEVDLLDGDGQSLSHNYFDFRVTDSR